MELLPEGRVGDDGVRLEQRGVGEVPVQVGQQRVQGGRREGDAVAAAAREGRDAAVGQRQQGHAGEGRVGFFAVEFALVQHWPD